MGADIAEQVTPVPMSPTLGQTLTRAAQYAQDQSHVEVSLEHLLLSLTEDDDARQVMISSGVDIDALQTDVSQQIGRIDARLPPGEEATVTISDELRRILNAAAVAARAGRRAMIDGAIVLAAIIGDAKTSAAGLLKAHGLTFEVAINVIRQANRPASAPPEPVPAPDTSAEPAPAAVAVPATATPPHQRLGSASDILAEARNRIASRKVAGYSDQIAARNAADEELPAFPPEQEASGKSQASAGIDVTAPETFGSDRDGPELVADDAFEDSVPPASATAVAETSGDGTAVAAPDPFAFPSSESVEEEVAQAPAPEIPPAPARTPPPMPRVDPSPLSAEDPQPLRPPAPSKPQLPQPPSTPHQPGQGWAPPPSGLTPPSAQPPRGAPPPIPPAMPSRPPAPVPTGRLPPGERRAAGQDAPLPPPQQMPRREPPWTGPPATQPSHRSPASAPGAAPLPSPEDVFSANARARQQAERSPPPGREPAPRGPAPDRSQRNRGRVPEAANSPTVLPGQLIENVPRRMRVGISSPVEVRIAKAEVKAISDGLDLNTTHRHDIQVTKAMSVRLRAPEGGFFIETASPETQWIENALGLMADDFARWRWTVTPKLRGKRKLQLIVAARTVGPDGLAAETALPDQIIDIKVSTNYTAVAKRTAGWTLAAVFGGLLAQFGGQIWTALEPLLQSVLQ